MDADGYPEDDELEKIRVWPYTDLRGLLDFMQERWAYHDYWKESDGKAHVSTAGWSGNEDMIDALQANRMAWMLMWEQSRRGGHYVFDLSRIAL